jgi:hypothetical protein
VFLGPDDDLALEVKVYDENGVFSTVSFRTTSAGQQGDICLPSSADVTWLRDDIVVAHMRMATLIADVPIGSTEWVAAMVEGSSANLQTAIGLTKVMAVRIIDQLNVEVDLRKSGTSNPTKVLQATKDQFPLRSLYNLDPKTQALVIAGAIEKEFPSYIHNHPSAVLSANQRTEIENYVKSLTLWI